MSTPSGSRLTHHLLGVVRHHVHPVGSEPPGQHPEQAGVVQEPTPLRGGPEVHRGRGGAVGVGFGRQGQAGERGAPRVARPAGVQGHRPGPGPDRVEQPGDRQGRGGGVGRGHRLGVGQPLRLAPGGRSDAVAPPAGSERPGAAEVPEGRKEPGAGSPKAPSSIKPENRVHCDRNSNCSKARRACLMVPTAQDELVDVDVEGDVAHQGDDLGVLPHPVQVGGQVLPQLGREGVEMVRRGRQDRRTG